MQPSIPAVPRDLRIKELEDSYVRVYKGLKRKHYLLRKLLRRNVIRATNQLQGAMTSILNARLVVDPPDPSKPANHSSPTKSIMSMYEDNPDDAYAEEALYPDSPNGFGLLQDEE